MLSKAPARNTGLVSSATTIACSGGSSNVPCAGSYTTYPPAAWLDSHSRTYRSAVPVRCANVSGVMGPAPAIALYRPSRSPRCSSSPEMAAAMSKTACPTNASSRAWSTGFVSIVVMSAVRPSVCRSPVDVQGELLLRLHEWASVLGTEATTEVSKSVPSTDARLPRPSQVGGATTFVLKGDSDDQRLHPGRPGRGPAEHASGRGTRRAPGPAGSPVGCAGLPAGPGQDQIAIRPTWPARRSQSTGRDVAMTARPATRSSSPAVAHRPWAKPVVLRDGRAVLIRQVQRADAALLADGFAQLSVRSRRLRFMIAKDHLSPSDLRFYTDVDHHDHEALGAVSLTDGYGVGIARYIRNAHDPSSAEIAITVIDAWQGRGLGTRLIA